MTRIENSKLGFGIRMVHFLSNIQWKFLLTSFISIIVLCGTDNILWNIPSFKLNMGNIPHNTINPPKHCY